MNGLAPRLLTAKTLVRTEKNNSYGNLAIGSALMRAEEMEQRDKALCTAIFQGVTQRRLTLDACIAVHSKRKPAQLDAEVRCVLRCGIYELLYLHTPDAAAVNLWTECVKKMRKTSAAGMVNAVLRGFLRGGRQIPLPDDKKQAMAVQYSAPLPLISLLLEEYDVQTVTGFLEDAAQVPPIYVRRNPLTGNEAEFLRQVQAEAVEAIPGAYRLLRRAERQDEDASPMPEDAVGKLFHVQDLASQLCCLALDPQPGETVLDVCAAPGGKTFTIAELMQNTGTLCAYDLHENRVKLIADGAKRLGLSCIAAQTGDARTPAANRPIADRILCDVPCSGYGVIRRKPEIRYKSPDETAALPEIQLAILEASAASLKPGGVLVYSTCTVLKRENEDVVRRFLAAHPEFQPEKPWQTYPVLAPFAQEMTTLFPSMLGSDGFFIAKLRKQS